MKRLLYILLLLLPILAQAQVSPPSGVNFPGPVIRNAPTDGYPTGYADLLNGGLHTGPNYHGRDSLSSSTNIPNYRGLLRPGMIYHVYNVGVVDSNYVWSGTAWIGLSKAYSKAHIDSLANGTLAFSAIAVSGNTGTILTKTTGGGAGSGLLVDTHGNQNAVMPVLDLRATNNTAGDYNQITITSQTPPTGAGNSTVSYVFPLRNLNMAGVDDITSDRQAAWFNALRVGTSTTAGYVLTGDASGNATFQAPTGAVSSLTTTGTSGAATLSSGVLNIPVYGGGSVTSVTGTTNRITSTGGTTPVIDISSTFEALLGKVANPLSQFASTTSSQLAGVMSDETGSGALVFGTSPTLVTPALGTPSALVGTNITGTATALNIGGNAQSATNLQTARLINGVSFNGTADITIPAGASLTPTAVQTSNYTASVGDLVKMNTTSGSLVVTLPTTPTDGKIIAVKMVIQGGSNVVTVRTGGSDVFNKTGGGTAYTVYFVNQGATFQYQATGAIWNITSDDLPKNAVVNKTLTDTISGRKTFTDTINAKAILANTVGYVVSDVVLGDSRSVPVFTPVNQGWAKIVTGTLRHNLVNHALAGRTLQSLTGGDNSIAGNLSDIPTYSSSYYYLYLNAVTNDINSDTTQFTYALFGSALRTVLTNAITTKGWSASRVKYIRTYFVPGATSAWGTAYRQKRYGDSIRAICTAYGVQLIDAYNAEKAQYTSTLGKNQVDGIHESPDGHSWLSNFILQRLTDTDLPDAGQTGAFGGQLDARQIRFTKSDSTATATPVTPIGINKFGNMLSLPNYYFIRHESLADTAVNGSINLSGGIASSTINAFGSAVFPSATAASLYVSSSHGKLDAMSNFGGTAQVLDIGGNSSAVNISNSSLTNPKFTSVSAGSNTNFLYYDPTGHTLSYAPISQITISGSSTPQLQVQNGSGTHTFAESSTGILTIGGVQAGVAVAPTIIQNGNAQSTPGILSILAPSLTTNGAAGSGAFMALGQSVTTNNALAIQFGYFSSGSNNNYGTFGIAGSAGVLDIYKDAISFNTSTRPSANTFLMGGVLDMGTHLISNVTDPSGAQDAATKKYVDGVKTIHGNSTTTGTATTVVTVTIGSTLGSTGYLVNITPKDLLTAVNYYISAQTTTTFDVTFVTALTGSINFDWGVTP